jgi:CRP/FNR family transcriptional regulator, cyclic AMP receptor protein
MRFRWARQSSAVEWAVLSGIPGEDVRELLSVARRRRFDRHEVVFHDGDPADSLRLITKGRFGIRLMTSLGDEVLLDLLGPGDVFGELV